MKERDISEEQGTDGDNIKLVLKIDGIGGCGLCWPCSAYRRVEFLVHLVYHTASLVNRFSTFRDNVKVPPKSGNVQEERVNP